MIARQLLSAFTAVALLASSSHAGPCKPRSSTDVEVSVTTDVVEETISPTLITDVEQETTTVMTDEAEETTDITVTETTAEAEETTDATITAETTAEVEETITAGSTQVTESAELTSTEAAETTEPATTTAEPEPPAAPTCYLQISNGPRSGQYLYTTNPGTSLFSSIYAQSERVETEKFTIELNTGFLKFGDFYLQVNKASAAGRVILPGTVYSSTTRLVATLDGDAISYIDEDRNVGRVLAILEPSGQLVWTSASSPIGNIVNLVCVRV